MTAHPSQNPHPERGPLWVQYGASTIHGSVAVHGPGGVIFWAYADTGAAAIAAQLGQDLPDGFTLAPVATGAALIAADPDGKEWERLEWNNTWRSTHGDASLDTTYALRRIAKPAKVRVKVGDAYGRTIDGKRIVDCGVNRYYPNGHYTLNGNVLERNGDADGMVEVDPLDGDR